MGVAAGKSARSGSDPGCRDAGNRRSPAAPAFIAFGVLALTVISWGTEPDFAGIFEAL